MGINTTYSHGLDQVTRAMIEVGANLEAQQNAGFTALMLASQNGHEQVCE